MYELSLLSRRCPSPLLEGDGSLVQSSNTRIAALATQVKGMCLLSMKPLVYAANVAEDDLADKGARNAYVKVRKEGLSAHVQCCITVSCWVTAAIHQCSQQQQQPGLESRNWGQDDLADKGVRHPYANWSRQGLLLRPCNLLLLAFYDSRIAADAAEQVPARWPAGPC
jgi:ribosome-binding ATPase YchF (GTP1/OBG family)